MDEPLRETDALKLIHEILENGTKRVPAYAKRRMRERNIEQIDVDNVLRGGYVMPGEREHGEWRYRVRTQSLCVVIAFKAEDCLTVVTAFREGK